MTMNRERIRNGKPLSALHRLVAAETESTRPSGRVLLFMSMAVVAGIAVALLWLNQNPRGSLEMLPQEALRATEEAAATEEAVAQANETAEEAEATAPEAVAAVNKVGVIASASQRAANRPATTNLSVQVAPAQQVTLVPPTPTPTRTPQPPLDSIEAVVAIGGATLLDDSGLVVGQAEQGELFTVTARSVDGEWLYGTLENGVSGWTSANRLIIFDASRLRSEDVVIIPITPTPSSQTGDAVVSADVPAANEATVEEPILRPTPIPGEAPLARVSLQDSRLNLRAGPGSNYPIVAKALPDDQFAILGRDSTSQWLQLSLPNVVGGFAWASAEFLTTDVAIADLPVSDDVSSAPPYQEGATQTSSGATKGGESAPPAEDKPVHTDARGGLSGAARGKKQQPASSSVTGLTGKLAIQTVWGGDIYIYDLATGDLRLLTGGFDPAISPDGTQVAFTRLGGEHGLYVINIDGTNERKIFSERTHFLSPKWSPDGQYIVFERGDEYVNCTLQPLDDPDPSGNCNVGPLPDNWQEMQQKLARVDINGNNYQDIPVLARARVPDWNSAGIVYQSPAGIQKTQDKPGAQSELVFFNIRKQYELDPDWQPNGGRIIFQRRENDHWEIYSVAPDGSDLTALTYPKFTLVKKLPSNVAPAWSPDGQHIVFLSNRDLDDPNEASDRWNVWVMNADGSNQRPLNIDLPFIYTFVAEQMLDWGR
jgi:Tol biopolymer transport system component